MTAPTQPRPASSADREDALARSAVYALLAGSVAYPISEVREDLCASVVPVVASLTTGDPVLDELLVDAVAVQATPGDELRAAHGRHLTHIESEDSPPYESAYGSRDVFRQTETMADVAGFYRAHGLRVGGAERQRPDHIATELDFMSFMARKEAYALDHLGAEEVDECRTTQAHFLGDHLGRWAPDFGRRLGVTSTHPFFAAVGALLSGWIDSELATLGIEQTTLPESPETLPPPDDGSCGFEGPVVEGSVVEGPGFEGPVVEGPLGSAQPVAIRKR